MPAPDPEDDPRPPLRRPYVAPAIEESSDFETLALACAASPGVCSLDDPFDPREPSS